MSRAYAWYVLPFTHTHSHIHSLSLRSKPPAKTSLRFFVTPTQRKHRRRDDRKRHGPPARSRPAELADQGTSAQPVDAAELGTAALPHAALSVPVLITTVVSPWHTTGSVRFSQRARKDDLFCFKQIVDFGLSSKKNFTARIMDMRNANSRAGCIVQPETIQPSKNQASIPLPKQKQNKKRAGQSRDVSYRIISYHIVLLKTILM